MIDYDVIIVGAGLGGLSLALNLEERGLKSLVLERHLDSGGVISSTRKDGFILEYGPNTVLLKKELEELIAKLDIDDRLLKADDNIKKRFIASLGKNNSYKLKEVPLSIKAALKSELISSKAKLKMLSSLVPKKRSLNDEIVYNFSKRQLGEEFTQKVLEPALSGIWASDIKSLSAKSALPELWELQKKHGSLALGLLKKNKSNRTKGKSSKKIISFKGGLQTLTKEMAKKLSNIKFGQSVERVFSTGSAWEVAVRNSETKKLTRLSTKALVLTSSQHSTSRLIDNLDSGLSSSLRSIPYSPVGLLHLAVNKKDVSHPLDGFGCLFQKDRQNLLSVNNPLLGVIFNSKLFPHFGAKGKELLTCFTGGAINPEGHKVSESSNYKSVIETLKPLLGIKSNPQIISGIEIPKAIPSYPIGHYKTVEHAKEFQASHPGLFLMANYIEGISLNCRVSQSNIFAKQIEESIKVMWGSRYKNLQTSAKSSVNKK